MSLIGQQIKMSHEEQAKVDAVWAEWKREHGIPDGWQECGEAYRFLGINYGSFVSDIELKESGDDN